MRKSKIDAAAPADKPQTKKSQVLEMLSGGAASVMGERTTLHSCRLVASASGIPAAAGARDCGGGEVHPPLSRPWFGVKLWPSEWEVENVQQFQDRRHRQVEVRWP